MTVKAETATPVAQAIWELLVELSMSRVRQRFLATVTELGLSFPQAHALKVLRPGHPIPMRELADGLHCDPSNITGIVDRLGDRGLVERGSAPGDRRVKTLMLTEEGTALRMRLLDRLSEPPPGLGKLPVDEQRQLLANILTVNATLVGQQQNEEMRALTEASYAQNEEIKRISAWAAILFAPTLIGTVYGMNFDHMPELSWLLGYPFALALMAVVCLLLYRLFRRRRWL